VVDVVTTALIGTGGLGSTIARRLAAGGETLRLSSADVASARALATELGEPAAVAADNRDAVDGADAVILALRFTALQGVIAELSGSLADGVAIVPSNPVGLDADGNIQRLLPDGQASGEVIAGWLPPGARFAMAFGTLPAELLESSADRSPDRAVLFYATDDDRAGAQAERLIRTAGFDPVTIGGVQQSSRLEVGGDLHGVVVGLAEARSLAAQG
jgi:8-hydroxy-5-deazaflavin:NADPH oxidoreductase